MTTENKTVNNILDELEAKRKNGYLFRGEPQEYDKVTSSLYRLTPPVHRNYLNRIEIKRVQLCLFHCGMEQTVENALTKNSEMQHYSGPTTLGPTNLIDFTRCPHIALFFACDQWLESDGRIVMVPQDKIPDGNAVEKSEEDGLFPWGGYTYIRREIGYPPERAKSQKSVFIHCKSGILEKRDTDYETITIPSEWKIDIRNWLASNYGIDRRFIYPDTLGFLQSSVRPHESIEYMLLAEQQLLKTRVYRYVIETCKRSTNEFPHPYVYHIWGIAHLQLGEKQEAIDKFDRALKIDDWRYETSAKNDARGRGNDENGAWIATQTAKNIAEEKRGEYPSPGAIFSLNHSLGKEKFPSRGGPLMHLPDIRYTSLPYTLAYQEKRWHVLNVFYDYDKLWDALPQLSADELDEQGVTQEARIKHEKEMADAGMFEIDLITGERIERSHDSNPEYYLDPEFYDPEFYRKLRCDEIENPLK